MRLFIAIDLDDLIKKKLKDYQNTLRNCGVTGNYSPEQNLHLTLAFIGEYGDPDAVLGAMEEVPFKGFCLETEGTGFFSDTLWAGTVKNGKLDRLVRDLRRALSDADVPFDRKRFRPHITLVRRVAVPEGKAAAIPQLQRMSMDVERISLFRSDRGRHGMVYTEIGHVSAIR